MLASYNHIHFRRCLYLGWHTSIPGDALSNGASSNLKSCSNVMPPSIEKCIPIIGSLCYIILCSDPNNADQTTSSVLCLLLIALCLFERRVSGNGLFRPCLAQNKIIC